MAIIPLFRAIIFKLITLLALVVLGICVHFEFLVAQAGYTITSTSFAPFGIGVACLTIISLPLFLVLGNLRRRVFTSTILFEIIWFFLLLVLWVGSAGDTVAGKAYFFPDGCIFYAYPQANQVCHEITIVETFAFVNFFCAFIYYVVIFLYAIINAMRGRGVWFASVKEATTGVPGTVNPGVSMVQPQFNAAPGVQYQSYGGYPANTPPPAQLGPYHPYAQQPYPQQFSPQGLSPQHYPQQLPPPQRPPSQQYDAYPQQAHPQSDPNQPYNYGSAPGSPHQQVDYPAYSPSPPAGGAPLPPQPNYGAYPVSGSQTQHPMPGVYQGHPIIPEEPLPSPYVAEKQ